MKKKSVIITMALLILCWANIVAAQPPVRIGVLAKRGAQKTMEKWQATGQYLSKRLKKEVRIVPIGFDEVEPSLRNKTIDFLLANSAFYARFQDEYNLKAIATMVNKKGIYAMDKFGGVVFVRKDSNIEKLNDIRGKRFMCVEYSSFGGAQMALRLLKENGINPEKDCAAFTEGGTHDNVVMAVLNHKVDIGTVRSDTLERMAAEGKISLGDFKIINEIKDGFQFMHSTRLYPEWPLAACQTTDPKLARDVAKALILLRSGDKAMMDAKVYSWTYPADYSDVKACLRIIGVL